MVMKRRRQASFLVAYRIHGKAALGGRRGLEVRCHQRLECDHLQDVKHSFAAFDVKAGFRLNHELKQGHHGIHLHKGGAQDKGAVD